MSAVKEALSGFCDTIEASGGIIEYKDGSRGCSGDPSWGDLADAYERACEALGREPQITYSDYDTWEDDIRE